MRINILGGPGTGKSTIAPWLFSELKHRRVSVEFAQEYVKHWVYGGREIKDFDQVYLFAKQQQAELRFLNNGVAHVITDSPCLLPAIYSGLSPYEGNRIISKQLMELAALYTELYPAFNIFLVRNPDVYDPKGRYQDLHGAMEVDKLIMGLYDPNATNNILARYEDKEMILDATLKAIS